MRRRAAKARNPSRDLATVKREFHQILLNDPTPEGLEVALDLLREHDISLEKISELKNTDEASNGMFVLRGEGEQLQQYVEWWVEPASAEQRGGRTIPRWTIDIIVKINAHTFSWVARDQIHHVYSGFVRVREWFTPGRFADRSAATTAAVGMAWLAVELLAERDPPLEVIEEVRRAVDSVWGPWANGMDRAHFEKLGVRIAENRDLTSNPPWVTAVIAHNWAEIERDVPAQWHPKMDQVRPLGARLTGRVKEFGCGAYGCVVPTLDPNIVLKATSDSTEAEFAKDLAPTLVAPICVIYQMVMKVDDQRKGNGIYLLWREAAAQVGELEHDESIVEFINDQHDAANELFAALHAPPDEIAPDEIVRLQRAWMDTLDRWAENTMPEIGDLAAGMLQVYREQGIFIGDVHAGNIGKVNRNGRDLWVITDPGHVVVIGKPQIRQILR